MKFVGIAIALILAIAVVSATNSTWGRKNWNDRLLVNQRVVLRAQSYNLTFPARVGANNKKISYIRVVDLSRFGNGGRATIHRNGIGHKNVTILFSAQNSMGLNMTTEIWGN